MTPTQKTRQYASEQDFVASFILPKMKEASILVEAKDILDFHVEKRINGGIADFTAEKAGKGLFIIEAKFKKEVGGIERDIEPRDPIVIKQAVDYAVDGGYPYYATCNTKRLILFQLKPGVRLYESEIASFDYERIPQWAEHLLQIVLERKPISLKPPDDALVDTLHEAFADIYPEILSSLNEKIRQKDFGKKYLDWLNSQGIQLNEENNRRIAEQTTYLQINKLLFYQIIRVIYPKLPPLKIKEEEDVSETLNSFYAEVKKIDYAPIYQSDVISNIPLTKRAEVRIRTLLDTINEFDFSKMENDFIGRLYEKLIPPEERKRLGQFYTPPDIVNFIIQLTVTKPNFSILDPGCGSGSFLVRAYHRLRELRDIPKEMVGLNETSHQDLLNCIYGVDINQFPAHLSVVNLAAQNPKTKIKKVNIAVRDFFDTLPGQSTITGFDSINIEGEPIQIDFPLLFDVVVANPPYIRQEFLDEKEKKKIKNVIEGEYKNKLFIGTPRKKVKNAIVMDKQSDIYIYFFIHGFRFLKKNGRLGFISSNKWLEVSYGEQFQQFILENTKILYVVEFDRAVFPDAEVDTAVTILEKEQSKDARYENHVRFVRVKKPTGIDKLIRKISDSKESFEDDSLRINIIQQKELRSGKWNVYLRAPPVFQKIVDNKKVKPLIDVVGDDNVFRGVTTGFNDFFILSKERVKEWGIEKRYLRPCLSSPKDSQGLIIRPEEISEYLFMVHDEKRDLKGTNALKYIQYGEKLDVEVTRGSGRGRRKLSELETMKSRKLWYSLPEFDVPSILFPRMIRERYIVFLNKANAHTQHVLLYIVTKENAEPLVGYLNSSTAQFLSELFARQYTGMLDMEVYEFKKLPVLDMEALSSEEKTTLSLCFQKLSDAIDERIKIEEEFEDVKSKKVNHVGIFEIEAKKKLNQAIEKEYNTRKMLDNAVYDILGLNDIECKMVEEGLKELRELRKQRTRER